MFKVTLKPRANHFLTILFLPSLNQNFLFTDDGAVFREIFCALQDCRRSPSVEHYLYPCWKAALTAALLRLYDPNDQEVYCIDGQYPLFKDLDPSDYRERVTPDFVGTCSRDDSFQRELLFLVELKPLPIPFSDWFSEIGKRRAETIFETRAVEHQVQAQNHFAKKRFHGTRGGWSCIIGAGVWFRLFRFTHKDVQQSAWKLTGLAKARYFLIEQSTLIMLTTSPESRATGCDHRRRRHRA